MLNDEILVLIDPGTYNYWNATFQRNQSPPVSSSGQYNTDLVRDKALGFLDDAKQGGKPFFLGVAPIGPHAGYVYGDREFTKPYPAKRHEGLFNNARVPRTYNYNPKDVSLSPRHTVSIHVHPSHALTVRPSPA